MSLSVKLKPYAQLIIAVLVAIGGLAVAAAALGHAIDPEHIGLWSGPNAFFFGMLRGTTLGAHQLPGSTLYVVAVMVVGICWFVSRELVGFARAGLARQAR
jgi:hypothetical protein